MNNAQKAFCNMIYNQLKLYAPQYGIYCYSAIIAQAIIESNWGKSELSAKYFNFFGLKCGSNWDGKSVNMTTKEEYTRGSITTIKDNFRVYSDVADGVKGYLRFINTKRYANLKNVYDYKTYIQNIKADGYATASNYVATLVKTVEKYGLNQYDPMSDDYQIALDVINGKYGNGATRKMKLGSKYHRIQKLVNEILSTKH